MSLMNLAERLNMFILSLKKNKLYALSRGEIGINLGSEDVTIKEYAGIDGSLLIYLCKSHLPTFFKKMIYKKSCTSTHRKFSDYIRGLNNKRIIHHNMSYGLPFKSNSVPNIYSSHFIEHLNEDEADKVFKECFRCLKKEGIIRIVVPDLDEETERIEEAIKKYKKGDSKPVQEFLTFDRNNHNKFSFHQKMYNFKDLKRVLEKTGFRNVERREYKKGKLPLAEKLDSRKGLIVEARK